VSSAAPTEAKLSIEIAITLTVLIIGITSIEQLGRWAGCARSGQRDFIGGMGDVWPIQFVQT
jgi:hypothetical protein